MNDRERVNCYIPRPMKERFLEAVGDSDDPEHSFSRILQRGVLATLADLERAK